MRSSQRLQDALLIHKQYKNMTKRSRRSAVERLASYGFNAYQMSKITGMSMTHALKYTDNHGEVGGYGRFNPATLDALVLLAVRYEDDETVSGTMLRRVVQWGTALRTVSALCEIPIEELREAAK